MTAIRISRVQIGGIVLAVAAALSFAWILAAQGQEVDGIVFPVAELGSCSSKDDCRAYCNEPGNMPQCIAFAKAHGLMNKDEAARAEKFQSLLEGSGGPGGCQTPESCRMFCENIANIDACIEFAEQNGFKDRDFEEGKKVRDYIKSGGALPGGCSSKESCEAYCSDFSHGEECLAFAKRAGIRPGGPEGREIENSEQLEKVIELMKRGETPGGCKSRDACEAYCSGDGHFEECIAFAEKAGFMKPGEAERIRKTGGKGPGGCAGREQCETYCNDETHREECFAFAEEHGFIEKEEIEKIKGGVVHLRAGLEQAPKEVRECLESVLGADVIAGIQSGERLPGPEIGERMRGCFEKFGRSGESGEVFNRIPPQIESCLKEKLGDALAKLKAGKLEPTPEVADAMRVCHQSMQIEREGSRSGGMGGEGFQMFLRGAPPAIAECLKEKAGADIEVIERDGGMMGEALRARVQECFQSFAPAGMGGMMPSAEGPLPPTGEVPRPSATNFPPQVLECVKGKINTQAVEALLRGSQPSADVEEAIKACFGTMTSQFPTSPVPEPTPTFVPPEGSSGTPAPVCTDQETCARTCSDASGQFYNYPECVKFRTLLQQVGVPQTIQNELPPSLENLPTDTACPDLVTCAARCTNETSPYYLKEECVQYRLNNPQSRSGTSLFFANILSQFKSLFNIK